MFIRAAFLSALLAFGFAASASAADFTPPKLTGRVVDEAHVLPAEVVQRLSDELAGHEAATSNQVVVATVSSLQGLDIETYANRLFRAWALGQKDKNNGVLFVIAPNEREMRIEVGYGLEGQLTDALTSQIIRDMVIPLFKAGDVAGGIESGTGAILKVLGGGTLPPPRAQQDDGWQGAIPVLIFFGIWVLIAMNARRRGGRGPGIWWGGGGGGFGGGGFGGGGGGFGGGGGSSGGGGASGRW
ncbi:MAG TPA: TPM domain-containing protein [Parvibaculum sp.]|jgi:uncharacterized protein